MKEKMVMHFKVSLSSIKKITNTEFPKKKLFTNLANDHIFFMRIINVPEFFKKIKNY